MSYIAGRSTRTATSGSASSTLITGCPRRWRDWARAGSQPPSPLVGRLLILYQDSCVQALPNCVAPQRRCVHACVSKQKVEEVPLCTGDTFPSCALVALIFSFKDCACWMEEEGVVSTRREIRIRLPAIGSRHEGILKSAGKAQDGGKTKLLVQARHRVSFHAFPFSHMQSDLYGQGRGS